MKNFNFAVPQDIVFGEGSLKKLPELMKKLGCSKVLVISDPSLKKLGAVDKVCDIVRAAGCDLTSFCEVEPNPSIETCEKACAAYKEFGAEGIVALGGGSPMDVAKAVGVLAKFGGKITDYEGSFLVPDRIVPLIAIPTTAGTGSEVTAAAVITDHSRNYKLTVFDHKLFPAYALLDPELISTVPAHIAASCGIDALVHAIEAYISKAASPYTDAMAEKAMELIGKNIRAYVADRTDMEAAGAMMTGSTFAGMAFAWARLGDVHAMAHPLGGYFNVPHGVANAILLPSVIEFNALAYKGKYEKIYRYISQDPSEHFVPSMLADEIRKLTASLGIPKCLEDVGVTEDKIPAMAADAMLSGNIAVNPRKTTQADIEKLYAAAMH